MTTNEARLFEIAQSQQGYFTTKQARACGYVSNNHPYHVRTGEWVRERRGIYRLTRFPRSPEGQYVQWSLWSRGRDDKPLGVYSHQTALSLHELSDLMPRRLHLTVPLSFRRSAKIPDVIVLHKAKLLPGDVEEREGFRIVTPIRAIVQLLTQETEDRGRLRSALREALDRGLVTRSQIEKSRERKALLALLGGKRE